MHKTNSKQIRNEIKLNMFKLILPSGNRVRGRKFSSPRQRRPRGLCGRRGRLSCLFDLGEAARGIEAGVRWSQHLHRDPGIRVLSWWKHRIRMHLVVQLPENWDDVFPANVHYNTRTIRESMLEIAFPKLHIVF